jgi:hypothetical protein
VSHEAISDFASKLAEAIRRRQALDDLAPAPPEVARRAEDEIAAAEDDLATEITGTNR